MPIALDWPKVTAAVRLPIIIQAANGDYLTISFTQEQEKY